MMMMMITLYTIFIQLATTPDQQLASQAQLVIRDGSSTNNSLSNANVQAIIF